MIATKGKVDIHIVQRLPDKYIMWRQCAQRQAGTQLQCSKAAAVGHLLSGPIVTIAACLMTFQVCPCRLLCRMLR